MSEGQFCHNLSRKQLSLLQPWLEAIWAEGLYFATTLVRSNLPKGSYFATTLVGSNLTEGFQFVTTLVGSNLPKGFQFVTILVGSNLLKGFQFVTTLVGSNLTEGFQFVTTLVGSYLGWRFLFCYNPSRKQSGWMFPVCNKKSPPPPSGDTLSRNLNLLPEIENLYQAMCSIYLNVGRINQVEFCVLKVYVFLLSGLHNVSNNISEHKGWFVKHDSWNISAYSGWIIKITLLVYVYLCT